MDGWMGGWMDGWMDGWVDVSKSRFKDCLLFQTNIRDATLLCIQIQSKFVQNQFYNYQKSIKL
jgi:hypothetical protein